MVNTLITLAEGDEALHPSLRTVVRRFSGRLWYVIPNEGGGSRQKLDITRPVVESIDDFKLPGIWRLMPREQFAGVPEDLLRTY